MKNNINLMASLAEDTIETPEGDKDDIEQISDNPQAMVVRSPTVIEVDGITVTPEKLKKMKSAEKRIKTLALFLDRLGLDAILGFIFQQPGDIVTGAAALYPVAEAIRFGYPKSVIKEMLTNVAIDFGMSLVTGPGDIVDIFYKANVKNHKLFEEYREEIQAKFEKRGENPRLTEAEQKGLVALTHARVGDTLKKG